MIRFSYDSKGCNEMIKQLSLRLDASFFFYTGFFSHCVLGTFKAKYL